jgi:rare lipoprotein A
MKKWFLCVPLLSGVSLFATAQKFVKAVKMRDSIPLNKQKNVATAQSGVASFYHDKFEGRQTATGDVFTQQKMTAACNTLPLNCWVRVTNIRNKKSVVVRINDRMHYLNKRLIDLSKIAAKELGYVGRGLTRVQVIYLGKEKPAELLLYSQNK